MTTARFLQALNRLVMMHRLLPAGLALLVTHDVAEAVGLADRVLQQIIGNPAGS
ncbi:MAG: hypothetical protein HY020_01125 [Burkholderiales bacterium]|nr:hypothetical protein [Burkholderiales bacterium]